MFWPSSPSKQHSVCVPLIMLFSLRELVQWLGFATVELFLHWEHCWSSALLVALHMDLDKQTLEMSWWLVFSPLFAADGLSTYFTAIVSIRLYQEGEKRLAVLRLMWVLTVLSLKLVCEVLLCQKLAEQNQAQSDLWFGLIVFPTFHPSASCSWFVLVVSIRGQTICTHASGLMRMKRTLAGVIQTWRSESMWTAKSLWTFLFFVFKWFKHVNMAS